MIARVHIFLPFFVTVPKGVEYPTYEYSDEGYGIRIYPLKRSEKAAQVEYDITVDDVTAFQADVLPIDFHKESFDRIVQNPTDPPERLIEKSANSFLTRLRYVTHAFQAKLINFADASWHIQYLNDDGSELKEQEGLFREKFGLKFSWSWLLLGLDIWNDIHDLPIDFDPPPWMMLLLDAYAQLPEVGPSIVLAVTALEVFISKILEALAKGTVEPALLWKWINKRDWWLKKPSLEEQFGDLLEIFIGKSLKSNKELWKAFKKLNKARNSFVHEGVAQIGDTTVSSDQAHALVKRAQEIIEYIRGILPEKLQWKEFKHPHDVKVSQKIFKKISPNDQKGG